MDGVLSSQTTCKTTDELRGLVQPPASLSPSPHLESGDNFAALWSCCGDLGQRLRATPGHGRSPLSICQGLEDLGEKCFCRVVQPLPVCVVLGPAQVGAQCPHLERLLVTRQDPDHTGSASPAQVGAPRDGHSDSSGHVRTQVADSPGVCVAVQPQGSGRGWLQGRKWQHSCSSYQLCGLGRSIHPSEP